MHPKRTVPSLVLTLALLGSSCTEAPTYPADELPVAALASSAAAQASGYINVCSFSPGTVWTSPGGTTHERGSGVVSEWTTGNALLDGIETNTSDVDINPDGTGVARTRGVLEPTSVAGTWVIRYQVRLRDGVPVGAHGTGRGTGDLQGMTLEFETSLIEPGTSACNPAFPFVVPLRVRILG